MHGLARRHVAGWLLGIGVAARLALADPPPTDACSALADLPLPPSVRLQMPDPLRDGACQARVELDPPGSWRDLYGFFRDLASRADLSAWTLGSLELRSRGGSRSRVAWRVCLYRKGWRYEIAGTHERTATATVQEGPPYPAGRLRLPEVDRLLTDLLPGVGDLESEVWEPQHYMRIVSFPEGPVLEVARSVIERLRAGDWQIRKIVVKLRDRPPWVAADSPTEAADMLREMPEEAGVLEARRGFQDLGISIVAAEGRVFVVLTLDGLLP